MGPKSRSAERRSRACGLDLAAIRSEIVALKGCLPYYQTPSMGTSPTELPLYGFLRSCGTRDRSRSRTGPRVPFEQIALHEGVDAPLERLEEGSHHHGRGEVGQPRFLRVREH